MELVRTTCSLCEASCGAVMTVQDGEIIKVNADREDPLSGGFICAKGAAIPALESDPDRVRTPLLRKDGELVPVEWDEAFSFLDARLTQLMAKYGRQAVGVYIGNAISHNLSLLTYFEPFFSSLGSTNLYTAATLDQAPRQSVSGLLYGDDQSVTVPDIDRTNLIWLIGANPAESNGSMMIAPGFLGRMQKLHARGGRSIVFDPRRTMTAERASEYVAISPSGDAAFLAAVAHHIVKTGFPQTNAISLCGDLDEVLEWLEPFTPEAVSTACGIKADTIVRLAEELLNEPKAAVYGRMGTTTQMFSSLVCWLIDLVNILAGNLDVVGGAMFPRPLLVQGNTLGLGGRGAGYQIGKWTSRVSNAPEVSFQIPMSCFAEEMEMPGEGQIRALITLAGNPALSSPDSARVNAAMDNLELIVSVDIYQNETTSKADLILPSPPRLTKPNYDLFLYKFAVRSYGRYTQPYRALRGPERSDREIMLRLTAIASGRGWEADLDAIDKDLFLAKIEMHSAVVGSKTEGLSPSEVYDSLDGLNLLEKRMDYDVRMGPFGAGFSGGDGIRFQDLLDNPQGLDCGALVERLPEILRTKSGRIEVKQDIFKNELVRLSTWIGQKKSEFVLIGRRQLRSNNSWFHNVPGLEHRTRECTAQISTQDAERLGIVSGDLVEASTEQGRIVLPAEVTEKILAGTVSIPHGWGHGKLDGKMNVAAANPGANVNDIIDYNDLDPLTMTARLNGLPINLSKVES